jgi:hypothetical protein
VENLKSNFLLIGHLTSCTPSELNMLKFDLLLHILAHFLLVQWSCSLANWSYTFWFFTKIGYFFTKRLLWRPASMTCCLVMEMLGLMPKLSIISPVISMVIFLGSFLRQALHCYVSYGNSNFWFSTFKRAVYNSVGTLMSLDSGYCSPGNMELLWDA